MANPRRASTRTFAGLALFVMAVALLYAVVRPRAALDLDHHWQVFGAYAFGAALLVAGASLLVERRYLIAVLSAAVVAVLLAALAHPVCVLIPQADRAAFETVIPLEERAARGEPFCKLGGEWYQCKSFVSRAFFF